MTYIQDWYYMQLEMDKAERLEAWMREKYDPDYSEDEDVPSDFRVDRESDCLECLSYLHFINCNMAQCYGNCDTGQDDEKSSHFWESRHFLHENQGQEAKIVRKSECFLPRVPFTF